MVVMAGYRLRGRGFDSRFGTFFFTPFFFCLIFPPFFFLHARSAISMLKHFSSVTKIRLSQHTATVTHHTKFATLVPWPREAF